MADEVSNIGEMPSIEQLSKEDREALDLHAESFRRSIFPNQVVADDDKTALEIIEKLPIWRADVKKRLQSMGNPRAKLMDLVTVDALVSSSQHEMDPLEERLRYEPKGPKRESFEQKFQELNAWHSVTQRAASIIDTRINAQ